MERAPASAVTDDELRYVELREALHCIGNDFFHSSAEMKAAHSAVDRILREEASCFETYIHDARVGAGTEDHHAEAFHMNSDHTFVHEQRVGLPRGVGRSFAEVVHAALFKRGDPRNLATVVNMVVEEKLRGRVVHYRGACGLKFCRTRHDLHGHDVSGRELDRTGIKHVGVHMDSDIALVGFNGFDGIHKGSHMVPVAVCHGDVLDVAELNAHVFAVTKKDSSFGACVEEHPTSAASVFQCQPQAEAEVGKEKCFA